MDDEEEQSDDYSKFILNKRDWHIINAANHLLWKVVKSSQVKPVHLVGLGKALYTLKRLPKVTEGVSVLVEVYSPRKWYDNREIWRHWTVEICGDEIHINSGGHHYTKEVGGDSFTTFQWFAKPGYEAVYDDYSADLWMIPELSDFASEVEKLALSDKAFTFSITDDSGDIDMAEEGEEDDDVYEEVEIAADSYDQELESISDIKKANLKQIYNYDNPEQCDLCSRSLENERFFVDGARRDSLQWANMCTECFSQQGQGIAWGKGQLYMRQEDDRWLMTAGFPPEEES